MMGVFSILWSALGGGLDYGKKALEIKKLRHEIASLRKEQNDSEQLVRRPTAAETETFGASYTERRLKAYYKKALTPDEPPIKQFIADSGEDK